MQKMQKQNSEIPLVQAARVMKTSYARAWDFVLRGQLEARQTPTGRWLVTRESLERLLREQSPQQTPAAASAA